MNIKILKLDKHNISILHKPFLIAEISGNHKGSLRRVLRIVEAAAQAGFNAIKLQTYTADTITLDSKSKDFLIKDSKSLWKNRYLHDLYKEAYTPWHWHKIIFAKAKNLGLTYFSTPFDETAVDFLETLNVPFYKISSFENNHFPLIKKIIETKKPLIISTGATTISELDVIYKFLIKNKCRDFCFLKCVSNYPSKIKDYNLLSIPMLMKRYSAHVGLSDHTIGHVAATSSIALGARIIEKHVTFKNNDGAIDSKFSLEVKNFKEFINYCQDSYKSLGKKYFNISKSEKKSLIFKRSIFFINNLDKGKKVSSDDIKIVRPNSGLNPIFWYKILGKRILKKAKKNTPTKLNFFYK